MNFFVKSTFMLAAVCLFGLTGCSPTDVSVSPKPMVSLETPMEVHSWDTGQGRGVELVTTHYRIYTTLANPHRRALVAGFLEAAQASYREQTHLTPPATQHLAVYLLASRSEWAGLTARLFGKSSKAGRFVENGAYTVQGVTVCWDIGGMATYSVLAHEGMHQFLATNLRDRLPLWAEEGLATRSEGFSLTRDTVRFTPDYNVLRIPNLRKGILRREWLGMDDLLSVSPMQQLARSETAGLSYYGQVYALVNFLQTRPEWKAGFANMIADAQAGRFKEVLPNLPPRTRNRRYHQLVGKPLFMHYITKDLESFEKAFRDYAAKLTRLD